MQILAVVAAALTATVAEANMDGRFVESLFKASKLDTDARRNLLTKKMTVAETATASSFSKPAFLTHDDSTSITDDTHRRHLGENGQLACDQAFMQCMPLTKCVSCFGTLQTEGIDWASVSPDTPCTDVVEFLFQGNYCTDMKGDSAAIGTFCSTYDVCVAWYEDQDAGHSGGGSGKSGGADSNSTIDIDCSTITTCAWDGLHASWIGDGICHENYPGCYNTAACNYDGGDCCEDKCTDTTHYAECGHDGFACRDPNSANCDPKLTAFCETPDKSKGKDDPDPNSVVCASDEAKYRLVMFDSFGDGWDETKITLTKSDSDDKAIFKGGLEDGAQGTEFVCLSTAPTCYHIGVNGGVWGNEVSWELRPLGEGTKALADGGAPMDCTFSVAGTLCPRTCTGKPNVDPTKDPDYKTYKELYTCIQEKCLIQVGTCLGDESCAPCFAQEAPEYCFANDNFNAVIDCGLCQCTDNYADFCTSKQSGPGAVIPAPDQHNTPVQCSAAETLMGSTAVMQFAKCSNFDQVGMMVTDFDENNFGALDQFEACAHSFANEPDKGGHTAMFCMSILADAMTIPTDEDDNNDSGAPKEAIAALAGLLYHNAESFCECTSKASADCPLCPSFMRFKTLLYESLDACKALDEIDCDAWHEFYPKCKVNLEQVYPTIDFRNPSQCDFVKDGCGEASPFPAFRKLDCGREISKTEWDFYTLYAKSCLQGEDGIPPSQPPSPAVVPTQPLPTGGPPPPPSSPTATPPPTSVPIMPHDNMKPSDDDQPKPYSPSDDDDTSSKEYPSSGGKKKKTGTSHFWRNILILGAVGCGAYFYYKRNNDSFSFVRYRNAPRNFGQESEMMMGGGAGPLTMADSGNFEPPSLPPPPSAMMPQQQQMGGYP
mmetsp:Transcript_16969/g.28184  ORF Transcript_16969/g.28184 Transcript_16969/m.28184 type:complete len:884 (-) Transcript_16969:93-2744(-)|eukprot:CAMPEP_0119005364 /NCGR_PEP_ID=MMETSP1176-20130426/1669_1 /TAXON_ID=265551 /ORGANISM="Synedropsis recta cf, Strain CCMP1620" /LENGTH=883 /DNA_ID=CAMNT_0006957153 /DNA_START=57 /DNA_END=2708 /DNA_ORIENTATION=-